VDVHKSRKFGEFLESIAHPGNHAPSETEDADAWAEGFQKAADRYFLPKRIQRLERKLEPSPPGRPKGRRNEKYKPVDPTIAAALQDSLGLTRMELAHKHSGLKTRDEKQKWIWKYDKEKAKETRPHPHS
jgi:hypothetical protein